MTITVATEAEQEEPAQELEFTFTFAGDKAEYKTYLSLADVAEVLSTSLLRGKPLTYMSIWSDGAGQTLIYDFTIAKKGLPAWKIQQD